MKKFQPQLKVGSLNTKKQAAPPTPPPSPPAQKAVDKPAAKSAPAEEEDAEPLEPFGDQVPYADPSWYQSVRHCSPDRSSTHLLTRHSTIRHTSTSHMLPSVPKSENGFPPKSSHMLRNGMKRGRSPMRSTSKWAPADTWPG